MDHDLEEDEMVPVKDLNGVSHEYALHMDPNQVFNQQRAVVAKLSRDDLEDRYLRLLEENVVIKKHACKQVSTRAGVKSKKSPKLLTCTKIHLGGQNQEARHKTNPSPFGQETLGNGFGWCSNSTPGY